VKERPDRGGVELSATVEVTGGRSGAVSPTRPGSWGDEDGSSAITSVFGVLIFLGFLMLATQVLVHLYATSTVSAIAFDTARRAAAEGADCDSIDAASYVRQALGDYGQRIDDPLCTTDGDQTVVTVTGPTPARLADAFGGGLGLDRIERTARVRTEDFRAGGP
jgi:hypothetical protein